MGMYLAHQALVQSYVDLELSIGTAFENEDFDPKNQDAFAVLTLLPNPADSLGKGDFDIDEVRGIFQISLYVKSGQSVATILPLIDQILGFYKHNRKICREEQDVVIVNSGRNTGRNDNGWFIIDCSITFKTDIQRI